jgi:penicillin-binding protein 2
MEKQWGGTSQQRFAADYARHASDAGLDLPPAPSDPATIVRLVDAEARAAAQPSAIASQAISPRPEAEPSSAAPAPRPTPSAGANSGGAAGR